MSDRDGESTREKGKAHNERKRSVALSSTCVDNENRLDDTAGIRRTEKCVVHLLRSVEQTRV